MKVIVLGDGPGCPKPGGATSGYLVVHGDTSLLIDCGTGVISNLQKHTDYHQVTGVVITHMHADHFLDLIPYRYGLKYAIYHHHWEPPLLYLPPGGTAVLEHVVAAFSETPHFFEGVFRSSQYDPTGLLQVGDLALRFAETRHPVPAYAISVEGGGQKLVFSGDTAPVESVVMLARDADLFICEAAIQYRQQDPPGGAHLTPTEAGEMGARAGVKRMLLTHLWPEFDERQAVQEASDAFGAPVELAAENVAYQV